MWTKTSKRESGRPASRTRTRIDGSALSRLASAQPADPPPTMTKSYRPVAMASRYAVALPLSTGSRLLLALPSGAVPFEPQLLLEPAEPILLVRGSGRFGRSGRGRFLRRSGAAAGARSGASRRRARLSARGSGRGLGGRGIGGRGLGGRGLGGRG